MLLLRFVQEFGYNLDELSRLLADDPMPAIHIPQFKPREEASDNGKSLITDIMTLGSPDEQCSFVEPYFIRVLKREIGHVIQSAAQDSDRYLGTVRGPGVKALHIEQQKLSHRQLLNVRGENFVGGFRGRAFGLVDATHAFDILWEVGGQGSVYRRVVHGDDVGTAIGVLQRRGHDRFGAHRVADQGGVAELVGLDEGTDIRGKSEVVVGLVVRRITVVAEIDVVDGTGEDAGKGAGKLSDALSSYG